MTEQPHPPQQASGPPFAGWLPRVGAYLLDILPIVILTTVLTVLFGDTESTSNSFSFQLSGFPAVIQFVGVIGWFVYNWVIRQGRTGQTVGKKVVGISVVGVDTRQPIGPGLSFARQLVHVVDSICFIGYLWPLWDKEKRTFADMIMSTRVVTV